MEDYVIKGLNKYASLSLGLSAAKAGAKGAGTKNLLAKKLKSYKGLASTAKKAKPAAVQPPSESFSAVKNLGTKNNKILKALAKGSASKNLQRAKGLMAKS